jgi:hypothetical protein
MILHVLQARRADWWQRYQHKVTCRGRLGGLWTSDDREAA